MKTLREIIISHVPAVEADFISTQVKVVVGEHMCNLSEELLQESPSSVKDRVDWTIGPASM